MYYFPQEPPYFILVFGLFAAITSGAALAFIISFFGSYYWFGFLSSFRFRNFWFSSISGICDRITNLFIDLLVDVAPTW
jgi:hypothetical protein